MSPPAGNGYVKWFQLVPTLIILSLALAGYIHAVSDKAMSKDVFFQFEKRFDSHTKAIIRELKELKVDLKHEIQQLKK